MKKTRSLIKRVVREIQSLHPGVEDVARLGCSALLHIALLPGGKKALGNAKALPAVKAAIEANPGSPQVVEYGRRVLQVLGNP